MNTTETQFDESDPALPELDALATRAARELRSATTGFVVAAPTHHRPRRLVLVAAAVAMVVVGAALVVGLHDRGDQDGQRTVTQPAHYLFPSYVPDGLRFGGTGQASSTALEDSGTSPAEVFASADGAKGLAAWTQRGSLGPEAFEKPSGDPTTVAGRPAVWPAETAGDSGSLVVDVGGDRLAHFLGRGLSHDDLRRIAAKSLPTASGPLRVGRSTLSGLEYLGEAPLASVLSNVILIGSMPAGGSALIWNDGKGSRALGVLTTPGTQKDLRIATAVAGPLESVEVMGEHGVATTVDGPGRISQLLWVDNGTLVRVPFAGMSESDALKFANSLESITAEDFRKRVAAAGGPLGSVEPGSALLDEGVSSTGQPWRVTVGAGGAGDICIQRGEDTSCGSSGVSEDAGGSQAVDNLTVDGGDPSVVYGSVGEQVQTVIVNGARVTLSAPGGTRDRRWFASHSPGHPDALKAVVVGLDRAGHEVFRQVLQLGPPATGSPATEDPSGRTPSTTGTGG